MDDEGSITYDEVNIKSLCNIVRVRLLTFYDVYSDTSNEPYIVISYYVFVF